MGTACTDAWTFSSRVLSCIIDPLLDNRGRGLKRQCASAAHNKTSRSKQICHLAEASGSAGDADAVDGGGSAQHAEELKKEICLTGYCHVSADIGGLCPRAL